MSKDENKNLIKKYMEEFNISYITAKQYISLKQRKQFEHDKASCCAEHFVQIFYVHSSWKIYFPQLDT